MNDLKRASMISPSSVTRCYLEPTSSAGGRFVRRGIEGGVVMLNLLRFHEIADYASFPELAPASPVSGEDAFGRYVRHTLPFLRESGGELLFLGAGREFLIGPEDERWDMAMLVRQASVASFLAFSNHESYLAGLGHRIAALEDSRLLPLSELPSRFDPRLPLPPQGPKRRGNRPVRGWRSRFLAKIQRMMPAAR